jgi:hypothetical protein
MKNISKTKQRIKRHSIWYKEFKAKLEANHVRLILWYILRGLEIVQSDATVIDNDSIQPQADLGFNYYSATRV